MYGLSIICLILYAIGGYLNFKYWGDKKNEDLCRIGGWIFLVAFILSVVIGVMAND